MSAGFDKVVDQYQGPNNLFARCWDWKIELPAQTPLHTHTLMRTQFFLAVQWPAPQDISVIKANEPHSHAKKQTTIIMTVITVLCITIPYITSSQPSVGYWSWWESGGNRLSVIPSSGCIQNSLWDITGTVALHLITSVYFINPLYTYPVLRVPDGANPRTHWVKARNTPWYIPWYQI